MAASHRTPTAYRWLDDFSGVLLCFLVVWAPWAFGCTITWAVNVLIAGCYLLGALLVGKWIIRWREEHEPARWVEPTEAGRWVVRGFAGLTVLFLAWVIAGALNAYSEIEFTRAGPLLRELGREPLSWLPSSYDAPMSRRAAFRWVGLAFAFWAARDWLLGKTRSERHHTDDEQPFPPGRLRQLLWTLALSSGLMAVVGLMQRFDGTAKLLWLLEPVINNRAETQFGPYPYRSNAAQYFNLVWPAVLGFWWALHLQAKARNPRVKFGTEPGVVLIPLLVLMLAVPIVTASRGGALMLCGLIAGVTGITALQRKVSVKLRVGLAAGLVTALALGWTLGGDVQKKRFASVFSDQMSGRLAIYETGKKMAAEFGWKGSGAETFTSLNYLYRADVEDPWQGYLHDDWLETYVTLGGVGLALAGLLLAGVAASWFTGKGLRVPVVFPAFVGLGLASLLAHAKFDLPFQIVSLQFMFLVMCAVLLASSGRLYRR